MKISRSCVTISHLYPRFDFFQTWYFVIKNTHQLRDPSKRSKVKILYLSRLATLNFSWSTMHLSMHQKLLNQLSRSFQFSFFLDLRSLTNLLRLFVLFPTNFCLAFLFTINSNRILFATKLYLSARIFKKNSPTENIGARFFPSRCRDNAKFLAQRSHQ